MISMMVGAPAGTRLDSLVFAVYAGSTGSGVVGGGARGSCSCMYSFWSWTAAVGLASASSWGEALGLRMLGLISGCSCRAFGMSYC